MGDFFPINMRIYSQYKCSLLGIRALWHHKGHWRQAVCTTWYTVCVSGLLDRTKHVEIWSAQKKSTIIINVNTASSARTLGWIIRERFKHQSRQLLIQRLYGCWRQETTNQQAAVKVVRGVGRGWGEVGKGLGSWCLIILVAAVAEAAAALHLDIIEEERSFTLNNGLKEGTSALAGGRALWWRSRRRR